jgi:RNA polymerase sigma factor (sigma-70 family)
MADPLRSLVQRLSSSAEAERLGDAELLTRYAKGRDAAAFEVLVWRHGGLVLGSARRLLGNEADAEDAFQATFLTLARKADSIRSGAALPAWLHLVTCRIAGRIRQQRRPAASLAGLDVPAAERSPVDDLAGVLDEEIARLPERFRRAVVLCYLEGRTAEEAAAILGVPRGTVLSRLAVARRRLRQRLERRDVAPAFPAASLPLSEEFVAATASLTRSAAPAQIVSLSNGVIRAMFWNSVRLPLAASLLAVASLAVIGVSHADKPAIPPADRPPAANGQDPEAAKLRRLLEQRRDTLREWQSTMEKRIDLQMKAGALEQMLSAQEQLLEVELELGQTGPERAEAYERALKLARELHETTVNRVKGGLQDPVDVPRTKAAVLKIEIAAQKERMKLKK